MHEGRASVKWPWRVLLGVPLAIASAVAALLYIGNEGIPFVEGDTVTLTGEAQGFRVGMTRAESFAVLLSRYRNVGAKVHHGWKRDADADGVLAPFEHPESKAWSTNPYAYYEEPVDALTTISKPLEVGDSWEVKLPGGWVNSVQVTFEADRVSEISRNRWLFERP